MKLLLKNINLLNPYQKLNQTNTNILIDDGIINKIGKIDENDLKNCKVLELDGKYIVPGLFDMHVHLT